MDIDHLYQFGVTSMYFNLPLAPTVLLSNQPSPLLIYVLSPVRICSDHPSAYLPWRIPMGGHSLQSMTKVDRIPSAERAVHDPRVACCLLPASPARIRSRRRSPLNIQRERSLFLTALSPRIITPGITVERRTR